ncbi:R8 protein [Naganishia albida]|nr:R8 protein [Naganishia albida]
MFFSEDFLMVKPGGLGIFWLAATLGARGRKGINKKQILDADISEACQKIMNPPEPIALRTSAGLMMGVVKIHDARYDLFVSDVTTLESAVKRASSDGAKGVAGNDKVNAANKANARAEAITVHHQPGQGFVPNLDLGQATWDDFLKSYGKVAREPSPNPFGTQEGSDSETLDSARARSATPEPERARHIASQDAINLPRYRHRSSSLLPGHERGSDPSDDALPDAAFLTPLGGLPREQTDSLLRPGQRRGSGTGSLLLAGGLDSSFSASDGGVDYAPVDLGFDLGIELPPLENQANELEPAAMEVDDMPLPMDLDDPPIDQGVREVTAADFGQPMQLANGVGVAGAPTAVIAPKHKKKPLLKDSTIEFNREEMERMKADYKARMTDARHEKLEEEQRKAALDHARIGVARPFGTSLPIAPELASFWNVVTKPPYEDDKKQRSGKRGKSRAAAGHLEGRNLGELGPLPIDDEPNLQVDEMQNFGDAVMQEVEREPLGSEELREVEMGRRASGLQMPWEIPAFRQDSELGAQDYFVGGASSTIGTGTAPRLSLATPQNLAERIARRARSSSIGGSHLSASAQKNAMLGDSSMIDEGHLELPNEAFPDDQMQLADEEPSQPSLPGNVNVNERQFLEYLSHHALGALPDDDDDFFKEDQAVRFSDLARPHEHKKAIAVNAFYLTLTLATKNLLTVEQAEPYGEIEIRTKRRTGF